MTITEMKEKRAGLIAKARELHAATNSPSDSQVKEVERLLDEADHLQRGIQLDTLEADLHKPDARRTKSPRIYDQPADDAAEWRSTDGTPLAVARRGQSLAAAVQRINGGRITGQPRVGEMLRDIITGQSRAATGGLATYAGYAGDQTLSSTVIDLARNASRVAQAGAVFVEMPSSELSMVKIDTDPTAAWVGEGGTIAESAGTFGRLNFRARKMGALVKISRELVEDSPNAVQMLEEQLGRVMGLELDNVALNGDGDGEKPVGIFNTSGIGTTGSVGSPVYDDWIDAVKAIKDANGMPTATIYSPNTEASLAKTKDSNNQYLVPPPSVAALSHLVTKQVSDTQAVVGDFTQLLIGVRSGITFERGVADGDFEKDLVAVKVTWRGDVQLARPAFFHTLTGIS